MIPGIEDALKSSGQRLTRPRRVVVRELQRSQHLLSAQEMYERVTVEDPQMDLSTVYRALNLLSKIGIARRKYLGDGQARYGLQADSSHQHACCEACGAGIEFEEALLDYLARQLEYDSGFITERHELTLHGHCASYANHNSGIS